MASNKRERELARMRAERQAARRAAAEARRRQRRRTIAATLTGAAVLAAAVLAVYLTRDGEPADKLATDPQPSASGATVTCSYADAGDAAKKVTGRPATKAVTTTTPAVATLKTNQGDVTLTLSRSKAPCTTNSFVFLANQKYFDDTPCHRLTSGGLSVLQCGDPSGSGSGGPGYQFADENLEGATYPRGTVAMANAGPGTNGSQFFLVYKDSQLPASYTPFGTITAGLDVIEKIAKAGSTPAGDGKPRLEVTIEKVVMSS